MGERIIQAAGILAAVGLVLLLVLMQQPVMSGPLIVAFWAMVAGVVLFELLARKVLKNRLAQGRHLEIGIEFVGAAVVAIAAYLFAVHVYPGLP